MDKGKTVVILGAEDAADLPGLQKVIGTVELRFANSPFELREKLCGAEILLGWEFTTTHVRHAWNRADRLRWIHWCGAGVDSVLFPELITSDVILTNSRGVFDGAIAEYVLALILAFAKGIPQTQMLKQQRIWHHRLTERVAGKVVLVVGVGGIGRAIARICGACGMTVIGIGRTSRHGDPDFGTVYNGRDFDRLLPRADYVVVAAPLTSETRGMFGASHFRAMKKSARLINVGRGAITEQTALLRALEQGEIAGAALDVFEEEPLPLDSPLWDMPHVMISPHMSGDFVGYQTVLVDLFLENLERFRTAKPLLNVVNKRLGYVPGQ